MTPVWYLAILRRALLALLVDQDAPMSHALTLHERCQINAQRSNSNTAAYSITHPIQLSTRFLRRCIFQTNGKQNVFSNSRMMQSAEKEVDDESLDFLRRFEKT